jgi:hypothetical protein
MLTTVPGIYECSPTYLIHVAHPTHSWFMWLTIAFIYVAHPHNSWFMWLTHTIPDLCGSPTRFLIYVGSPTFLVYVAHMIPGSMLHPQILIYVAHPRFLDCVVTHILIMCSPHTPDSCGSPTRFLIYVAHPHIPDLCGSPQWILIYVSPHNLIYVATPRFHLCHPTLPLI